MKVVIQYGVAALVMVSATLTSTMPAVAWGCVAEAKNGKYGYSYEYSTKAEAQDRAMKECLLRTKKKAMCKIKSCEKDA